MPTGYTSVILEGADFKKFALTCARAFGATVMQRGEPLDAPLKTEFEQDSYYTNALANAIAYKKEISAYTTEQWVKKLDEEHKKEIKRVKEQQAKELEDLQKYKKMEGEVLSWKPPTSEHREMKIFMLQQIRDSIQFDCNHWSKKSLPEKQPLNLFIDNCLELADRDIAYYKNALTEETKTNNDRSEWIKSLINSLNQP